MDCLIAINVGYDRQVGIRLSGADRAASPEPGGAESGQ